MYTTDNALTTLACSIPTPLLFGDQHGTRRCFGGGSTLGGFLNRFGGGHQGICQEPLIGTEPRSTQLSCIPKSWDLFPDGCRNPGITRARDRNMYIGGADNGWELWLSGVKAALIVCWRHRADVQGWPGG